MKRWLLFAVLLAIYGCATTAPQPAQPAEPPTPTHGVASWYGQEFAGRTTANGEIFDPLLMTAAHRTLPFGTLVDVTNPKTTQTVRVRINDRGPYIGNRLIDLSYAAAQQIGLVDPGSGEVDLKVVKVGKGEREPPAPYTVTIAGPTAAQPEAPKIEMPAPQPVAPVPAPVPAVAATPEQVPVVVDKVQVVEEHHGVETRRQVSPSGKSVEVVPVPQPAAVPPPQPAPATQETRSAPGHSTAEALDAATHRSVVKPAKPAPAPAPVSSSGRFIVQVGAFSIEANAKSLQERLAKIGEQAWIDHTSLYHVRLGPFDTREQAIRARSRLESAGISAIVVMR